MKKWLSLLLTVCLLCGLCAPAAVGEAAPDTGGAAWEELPAYYAGLYGSEDGALKTYFLNGNREIPYFDPDTVAALLEKIYRDGYGDYDKDPGYALTWTVDGSTVTFTRENGYSMTLDFDMDTVYFRDYDMFVCHSYDEMVVDLLHSTGLDGEGRPKYLKRNADRSYSRYGRDILVDLARYHIDLPAEDGLFLIPAQTLTDLLINETYTLYMYNGSKHYLLNYETLTKLMSGEDPAAFTEEYFADAPHARSRELTEFTYNELCMALDLFYGLKGEHGIDSFDDYFEELAIGNSSLKDMLLSDDPEQADEALSALTSRGFDDLHSGFLCPSPYAGLVSAVWYMMDPAHGETRVRYTTSMHRFTQAREAAFPDGVPAYQEVGNTAFITFDTFTPPRNADYYTDFPGPDASDTVGLLIYAHSQITRENSPIENVVLDLSLNSGGAEDAAAFTCAWFLGNASVYLASTLTDAMSMNNYSCDANLDRTFDFSDSVADRNLYCLTSPVSFSCGNLAPCMFSASDRVTLIGQTTGGGSCVVHPMTTASGAVLQVSGFKQVSCMKNGSFYNADQGVAPHVALTKPASYYDREALTEMINTMK